jgi:hypothetical protein
MNWSDLSRQFLLGCDWLAFALLCILLISPAKFDKIEHILRQEYGMKKRVLSWLEREIFDFTPHSTAGKRALATALMLVLISNIFYLTHLT